MLFVVFIVGEACTVGVYDSLLPLMLRGHRSEILLYIPGIPKTSLVAYRAKDDEGHSRRVPSFTDGSTLFSFFQRVPGEHLDFSTSSTSGVFTSTGSIGQASMIKARALSDRESWNPTSLNSAPPVSGTVKSRDDFTPFSSPCRKGR